MRTRFLTGADHFLPVQTLDFLRLPLPHVPPLPPHILTNFDELHCFHDASLLSYALPIENFPIENALSKFLADSLPHVIDFNIEDFSNDQPLTGKPSFVELQSFDYKQRLFETEASERDNEVDVEEKVSNDPGFRVEEKYDTTLDTKGGYKIEFVRFEVTEPDLSIPPLESARDFQSETVDIFTRMSNAHITKDMPNLEVILQKHTEVENAVYSIDDIIPDYSIKQQFELLEEVKSELGIFQSPKIVFPLLEVDESSLGFFSEIYAKQDLPIFETIEAQNWTLEVDSTIADNDLLFPVQFDLLEYLSDHLELCSKVEVPCSNLVLEMELISAIEHSDTEEIYLDMENDGLTWARWPYSFEEFQFFDLVSSNCFEVFFVTARERETETCETMFSAAMSYKNFNELIVSHELTLIGDSFKALPVPILLDHEEMKSLVFFLEETVKGLDLQCSLTSDGLYLDWHLLEEHSTSDKYSVCWKQLGEVNLCRTVYDVDSSDLEMLIFSFVLSDDGSNRPSLKEEKETLNVSFVDASTPHRFHDDADAALRVLPKDELRERVAQEMPSKNGIKNISLFAEAKSRFNDLDFFLHPLECAKGRGSRPASPFVSSSKPSATCPNTIEHLQAWNVRLHPVKLSNDILNLINNFHENFEAILQNNACITEVGHSPGTEDGFKCIDWIHENFAQKAGMMHGNNSGALSTLLWAIKQTAWYLIYYGLRAAYIYINKLCKGMELFRLNLNFLHKLIEDAHAMTEKDIHKNHPSLSVVQEILNSNKALKILIVADRIIWSQLERLLTFLGLSYIEPQLFFPSNSEWDRSNAFTDAVVNSMLCADCCLISHEFISTSFPFNKYGAILEYGGPLRSSKLSASLPAADGCLLHFLKVELDDSSICKAICEGVEMPQNMNPNLARHLLIIGEPFCIPALHQKSNKTEELLSFIPNEEGYRGRHPEVVQEDTTCTWMPPQCGSSTMQNQIWSNEPSFPKNIIIVNTLNLDKEMIVSRRSTYQRILAMEKAGVQLVERDLNFPADVIINAAVCLAWYNCKNIGKKATAPDEAFSCLPLCVENIAASILTSLSFSFGGCIMVFEGENNYITGIMESSDELYAAAASLGVDLQLFYSYSSEMTDEIILSCINVATKSTKDCCPRMTDSETLAESFLTAFPSVNHLSAHAILSTGGNLVEFLEWSQERRIRAVQKFHVPDESIKLLSALSRYGEQENSISGMTDCSSSVSSAPDSENMHFKNSSESKKRRYMQSHQNSDMAVHDSIHCGSQKLISDRRPNPPGALEPYCSERFYDFDKSTLSCNDEVFDQGRQWDNKTSMMKYPSMSEQSNLFMTKGPDMLDEMKFPKIPQVDMHFRSKQLSAIPLMDKIYVHNNKCSRILHEDLIGEVIDADDGGVLFRNDFNVENSDTSSKYGHDVEDTMSRNFDARRLSHSNAGNRPTFPTAAEIEIGAETWFSLQARGKSSTEGLIHHRDTTKKQTLGEYQKGLLEKSAPNYNDSSILERNIASCGETPLSNAVRSAQPQQGSPWTIEFLNRIREKSIQRRQSLPRVISSPSSGSPRNGPIATKRKSQSILESFKYQSGTTPKKVIERKRHSRFAKPSYSSKAGKPSTSFSPSWTPADKRARRTLSFSTYGGGGQSKLVWGEGNAYAMNRRF